MSEELAGRRAHVTGAGRSIGLAIAQRLAEAGARVAISDVDEEAAKSAAASLPGEGHIALRCDVTSKDEVDAAMAATVEAFGGLDVLVNNAGIEIACLLHEMSDEDMSRILDINVVGVQRCTRAAIGALIESKGCVVNISSLAGTGGAPLLGAYCGSKAAVIRMTEVNAIELRGTGVRFNAVCPAFIDTPMVERLVDPVEQLTGAKFSDLAAVKQQRLGTVEEVAEVVAFLASDEASWTTGSHYIIDGGLSGSLL